MLCLEKTPTDFAAEETNNQHRHCKHPANVGADSSAVFHISLL